MKANEKNKTITNEIKGYLENLEFEFIDNDILEDIRDFFEEKQVQQNTISEEKINNDVSHEAQVAFIIEHGIEIKPNIKGLQSDYLAQNFKKIEFYGVRYYLRIQDYGEKQVVFDYIIDNHIVSVAA